MKITDGLLGEHALFYALFDSIEQVVESATTLDQLEALSQTLGRAVLSHAELEDEILFTAITGGPVAIMRAEHEDIGRQVRAFSEPTSFERAKTDLRRLLTDLRAHFRREEQIVFPVCEAVAGDGKLRELGAAWARKRGL
jgi:iron-sulfur cluster repair protein YtfE (RIC family)